MRDLLRISLLLGAVAICAASATAPKKRTIKSTSTVTTSPTDTFTILGELFAKRGWKLITQDKAIGMFETDWVRIDAAHVDCGAQALG